MRGCRAGAAFLFKLYQRGGYYAGNGVRTRKGDERAGYFAHDANGAAAIDEVDIMFVEGFAKGSCGGEMGGRDSSG